MSAEHEVETERWAAIPSFDGYEVSDAGAIRSKDRMVRHNRAKSGVYFKRGQTIRQFVTKLPTSRVYCHLIRNDGVEIGAGVGRTVLEAFVGPCPDGMECCHSDGDRWNNRLSNLRWDTKSENQLDSVRHGTHASASKTHCPAGHIYDEANTRIRPNGKRTCRACHRRISKASRERGTRRLLALAAFGAVLAGTGIGWAGQAQADYNAGRERVDWGFLASGYRTICDGPRRPDGSWERTRRLWTPAHWVSGYCSRYSCSAGYPAAESTQRLETYIVFDSNVLPNEPGWLPAGTVVIR